MRKELYRRIRLLCILDLISIKGVIGMIDGFGVAIVDSCATLIEKYGLAGVLMPGMG
jgi:hypothetical protein